MVPHHGTNWAALRLTAQIGRDAVLSESYGRGYRCSLPQTIIPSPPTTRVLSWEEGSFFAVAIARTLPARVSAPSLKACPKAKSEQKEKKESNP